MPTHEVDDEVIYLTREVPASIKKEIRSPDPRIQKKGKRHLVAYIRRKTDASVAQANREASKVARRLISSAIGEGEKILHRGLAGVRRELMREQRPVPPKRPPVGETGWRIVGTVYPATPSPVSGIPVEGQVVRTAPRRYYVAE